MLSTAAKMQTSLLVVIVLLWANCDADGKIASLEKIEQELTSLRTENNQLKQTALMKHKELQECKDSYKQQQSVLKSENEKLQQDINTMNNRTLELDSRHSGAIPAFQSRLRLTYTPGVGSVIIFDHILYNTGEYSTATGVFIAPVSGLYVFSYTLYAVGGSATVDLEVDSATVATLYIPRINGEWTASSGTTIVSLNQLQEVMLRYKTGSPPIGGDFRSMFSGYLLTSLS